MPLLCCMKSLDGEDFARIDASELRGNFLGHVVPPPGWLANTPEEDEMVVFPPPDPTFTCDCLND